MITIRLLGGAKKALGGRPSVDFERTDASVSDILQFLQNTAADPRFLQMQNLIFAINGIDSSALQGEKTIVRSGDEVAVVTVVHGGALLLDGTTCLSAKGVRRLPIDQGIVLERMRNDHESLSIQAANADQLYGIDHILGALRITLEAQKRKVMLTNKPETDLLLRLARTKQISKAIQVAGLRMGAPGCFIAFSDDAKSVFRFEQDLAARYDLDDRVLEPSMKKNIKLSKSLGLSGRPKHTELLETLLENAAILVK